jgi:hypothetical protein
MSKLSLQLQQQREDLFQRLAAHGQEHLLHFADLLDDDGFKKLAEDISEIDFDQLSQIVTLSLSPASALPSQPIPLPHSSMLSSRDVSAARRNELFADGLKHIAASRVALIILAGGQVKCSTIRFCCCCHVCAKLYTAFPYVRAGHTARHGRPQGVLRHRSPLPRDAVSATDRPDYQIVRLGWQWLCASVHHDVANDARCNREVL